MTNIKFQINIKIKVRLTLLEKLKKRLEDLSLYLSCCGLDCESINQSMSKIRHLQGDQLKFKYPVTK